MDTVSFQTNAFPMILPKHNSVRFFWCAGISNFFYWCSFALHKIFAVGRHIVQVLECCHAKWNKRLPFSVAVKIISRTASYSWIPSSFRRGNHGFIHVRQKKNWICLSVCLMNNVIIAESCCFINDIQLYLYFHSEGPKWNLKALFCN